MTFSFKPLATIFLASFFASLVKTIFQLTSQFPENSHQTAGSSDKFSWDKLSTEQKVFYTLLILVAAGVSVYAAYQIASLYFATDNHAPIEPKSIKTKSVTPSSSPSKVSPSCAQLQYGWMPTQFATDHSKQTSQTPSDRVKIKSERNDKATLEYSALFAKDIPHFMQNFTFTNKPPHTVYFVNGTIIPGNKISETEFAQEMQDLSDSGISAAYQKYRGEIAKLGTRYLEAAKKSVHDQATSSLFTPGNTKIQDNALKRLALARAEHEGVLTNHAGTCGSLAWHWGFEVFNTHYKKHGLQNMPSTEIVTVNGEIKPTEYDFCTHTFIVINRDPNSVLENPATWGPEALVIDSWANPEQPQFFMSEAYKNKDDPRFAFLNQPQQWRSWEANNLTPPATILSSDFKQKVAAIISCQKDNLPAFTPSLRTEIPAPQGVRPQ